MKQGGAVRQSSYKSYSAYRASQKPDMRSVHNSRLAIGAKTALSLTDMDEGYHIEISE
jgi:hypothetical protein